MKKLLKRFLSAVGVEIKRVPQGASEKKCVSLKSKQPAKGNVLLGYILDPFLVDDNETISFAHTHHYESTLMAQAFLEMGYDVDVISFMDRDFIPRKDYVLYMNARENFEHLAKRLDSTCIKIVHLDTSHFLINNYASLKRSVDLRKRRGVTLVSDTIFNPNRAIETCDYATMLGNKVTIATYSYANKKIFPLNVPTPKVFKRLSNKDFNNCRKSFLWFGSRGFVHKGLDVTLEAFSRMPDCNLTVCGPFEKETQFVEEYHNELYELPNVNPVGWVDIDSVKFEKIIQNCIGLIHPSCADGQAGAVVTCMQAGLIPLVSNESGVDVDDFGTCLNKCTVEEIIEAVKQVSSRSAPELREISEQVQNYSRVNHAGDKYVKDMKTIITEILRVEAASSNN